MKAARSEGGLSRGRMRNSDSGHKCWVQTLNHFADVNQHMEEGVKKQPTSQISWWNTNEERC